MTIQGNELFYGQFTSDGNPRILEFGTDITSFYMLNQTQFGAAGAVQEVKRAWWVSGMAADSAFVVRNTAGAATDESSFFAAGGFTAFSYDNLPAYPLVAIASISNANPGVVTTAAPHNLRTGDIVQIVNSAMNQINGLRFTVTVTAPTTFSIPINTTTFPVAGAVGSIRRIAADPTFAPMTRNVIAVTNALNAVVSTSQNHGYQIGDRVSFRVEPGYGMSQLNNVQANVVAVTALTFTIDLDTTAFAPFVFPATALVYTVSRPVVVPLGANSLVPNYLGDATDNIGFRGLEIGGGVVGNPADVIFWVASRGLLVP